MKTQIAELYINDQFGQPVKLILQRTAADPVWRILVQSDRPGSPEMINPDFPDAAAIKVLYESNEDTNGFSDEEKTKLDRIIRSTTPLNFESFFEEGTTKTVAVVELPDRALVKAVILEVTEEFAGGDLTAVEAEVGITGTADHFISSLDVFAAPIMEIMSDMTFVADTTSVEVTLTGTTDDLDALEQGALMLHVQYEILPVEVIEEVEPEPDPE